jgi:hypothetical protein
MGEFDTDCGGGVFAGRNTSCPFAQNLREQYMSVQRGGAGGASSVAVDVYSPVTGQTHTMNCVRSGDAVTCRGGNDAAVWFQVE